MAIWRLLADAFDYPSQELADELQEESGRPVKEEYWPALLKFIEAVHALSLAEWQELYCATLDLSPKVVPYVGFQIWGDGYHRRMFMVKLSQALESSGVDPDGELPDHLVPVFRYLEAAVMPDPELLAALGPAIQRMVQSVQKAGPDNPYQWLFKAAQGAVEGLNTTLTLPAPPPIPLYSPFPSGKGDGGSGLEEPGVHL